MDKLANFKILLSKERLESYNNEIDKHYENLKLIGNITPKDCHIRDYSWE